MRSGLFNFLGSFSVLRAVDPYWANVVSLMEFEGANNATTTTDARGLTWTFFGNAKISNGRSKGGATSLLLDGGSDYISTPYNAALDFGTGDFTIEWYSYINTLKPLSFIDFRGGTATSPRPMVYNTFSPAGTDLFYFVDGANRISAPSGSLVASVWQHIAISRVSGVTRLFVDGVQKGANYTDGTNYTNNGVLIGRNTATIDRDFNGNIDGWRVTKGVGRYSAAFSPPALPYLTE